jgi:putative ABC transport system permease protein
MLWSAVRMAIGALRRHPMRSALTAIGIVIGAAAAVNSVTMAQGAMAKVTGDIAALGTNLLLITPGSEDRGASSIGAAPFAMGDIDAIARDVPAARIVAASASRELLVVHGNKHWSSPVTGITASYFEARGAKIAIGRAPSPEEQARGDAVCVIGAKPRKELFGNEDPIGAVVRAGNVPCAVIGALESKGQSFVGGDQDDVVLTPLRMLQRRVIGRDDAEMIYVSARTQSQTAGAKKAIVALLRERRRLAVGQRDNFTVTDMRELAATFGKATAAFSGMLVSIALVSLLVGGVGIMNIMLVNVTERTREIGVRLAIGALPREILLQFLIESATLSLLGGALGVLFGLGGALGASLVFALPFRPSPVVVVGAFVFCAAVGVGFGFYPAKRAAGLHPIEALRHD